MIYAEQLALRKFRRVHILGELNNHSAQLTVIVEWTKKNMGSMGVVYLPYIYMVDFYGKWEHLSQKYVSLGTNDLPLICSF